MLKPDITQAPAAYNTTVYNNRHYALGPGLYMCISLYRGLSFKKHYNAQRLTICPFPLQHKGSLPKPTYVSTVDSMYSSFSRWTCHFFALEQRRPIEGSVFIVFIWMCFKCFWMFWFPCTATETKRACQQMCGVTAVHWGLMLSNDKFKACGYTQWLHSRWKGVTSFGLFW